MRILVNDIAASTSGALSILKDFYQYIKENDCRNEWIFLLGDHYIDETERIKVKVLPEVKKSRIKKLAFDFITGKKYIKKLNVDLVLSLQNTAVFGIDVKQIVYLHQSIPFQDNVNFSFLKREERALAIYQYLIGNIIKMSIKKANYTIVQTQWMKEAVIKKVKISEDKISVISPEIIVDNSVIAKKNWDNKKFFYPTSDAIYKNVRCIDEAVSIIKKDAKYNHNIEVTIPDGKYENINGIGYISREKVLNKYNESTLIFPSYIESSPLPLSEARIMGTLILASDCAFSHEILKDYSNVYYFNPFKPEELAELIEKVINGVIVKREITSKPVKEDTIYKENSWKKLIDIIDEFNCKCE